MPGTYNRDEAHAIKAVLKSEIYVALIYLEKHRKICPSNFSHFLQISGGQCW
jgi:hypothetical protein